MKNEMQRTNAERLGPLLEERVLGLLLSLGVWSEKTKETKQVSTSRGNKEEQKR